MCPSVHCPVCGRQTYHKGWCENPDCGFAPYESSVGPYPVSATDLHQKYGVDIQHHPAPFSLVRITDSRPDVLARVAEDLGYDGQIYQHEADPSDMFDQDFYGIDLVRDHVDCLVL